MTFDSERGVWDPLPQGMPFEAVEPTLYDFRVAGAAGVALGVTAHIGLDRLDILSSLTAPEDRSTQPIGANGMVRESMRLGQAQSAPGPAADPG